MAVTPAKRIRRTSEEARRLILDAADICMAKAGPAGLRLQEVAELAGVSHPTVLHHFESREGLIRALNQRSVEQLGETLRAAMAGPDANVSPVHATFAAFRDGLAQRMLWIMQSGPPAPGPLPIFEESVDRLHALRERLAKPGQVIDREDTRHMVHLSVVTAFGDAVIGARLRRAETPQAEAQGAEAFAAWFARLLDDQVG
jgi:AcrR family transcriptional regulator